MRPLNYSASLRGTRLGDGLLTHLLRGEQPRRHLWAISSAVGGRHGREPAGRANEVYE